MKATENNGRYHGGCPPLLSWLKSVGYIELESTFEQILAVKLKDES